MTAIHRTTTTKMPYQPVVILGAGRSGTNLLRDALTRLPNFATWPCDEVNYLWRSGNTKHPTDELTPDMATASVRRHIRSGFDWVAKRYHAHGVVEKTCANMLRVDFVDAVIPEAKYLHLTRDGYDVTASAMKRWAAPIEPKYLLKKARFVPPRDLPYYASRYLLSHCRRLASSSRTLSTWGPRFEELDELRRTKSLAVVCATQWRRCLDNASRALARMEPGRALTLRYEDLVSSPAETLQEAADFLGVETTADIADSFARSIRTGSVGAGHRELSRQDIEAIRSIVESKPSSAAA